LFFFSSRRRHTRFSRDWSSDVCSSDLVDEFFVDYLDGHAQRRRGRALPDARLQHEQATLLDRELDVAHVAVVIFEQLHQPEEFRSEERRVGKECRARWSPNVLKKRYRD